MEKRTREALSKAMEIHKKPGAGGTQYDYIKGDDVIARLNEAFDYDWDSKVLNTWVVDNKIKQVMVHLQITAKNVTHEGFGGAEIAVYAKGPKTGDPIDISNSYKSALTSAVKSTAKHFGIGLISDEVTTPRDYKEKEEVETSKPVSHNPLPSTTKVEKEEPKQTLAETFKEEKEEPKEVPSFAPSTSPDSDMVNDIQVGAMNAMCTMKSVTMEEVLSSALNSTDKKDFKELTTDEARKVITHLHSIKKGS